MCTRTTLSPGWPPARLLILATLLLAATTPSFAGGSGVAEEPRSGGLVGVVVSEVTRQPVAGAVVTVEGTSLEAVTDETGRFQIWAVPEGEYGIIIAHQGFLAVRVTGIIVTAKRDTPISVRLHETIELTDEISVEASSYEKPLDVTTGSFDMSYEEVRRAPGALADIGRMIQALPGGAARDDQRNDIVARGGSPSENLTLVDGFEIPNLSHFGGQGASGGPISMLNTELVNDASFLAGGSPAPYGNRLSSVLEVSLREGNRERFEAEVDVSMAGGGVIFEGPLGERGSWIFSARRSYIDLIAGAYGLTSVPQYANYQVKAVYDITPSQSLSLVSLGGWDTIEFDVDPEDLEDANTTIVESSGWRTITGLSWRAFVGSSGYATVSVAHSLNEFEGNAWDTLLDDALIQSNRSREGALSFKGDLTFKVPGGVARCGASARRIAADFDIAIPLGTENVFSTDSTRVNPLLLDETVRSWQTGTYLQLSQHLGSFATATVGGRYDRFVLTGAQALSPRASLAIHLRPNLDLSATYGRYYQSPALVFMKAHPDNVTLDPIQADHYVAGLAYYPRSDVKLSVEAYQKRYDRYPVSAQFPMFTMADTGEQYDVHFYMIPLTSQGQGRASGIEAFVQKRIGGRAWGQVSYAYSRTEQRALDGQWRPGAFDLPHVLSTIAGFKLTPRLEISSKFSYTSGRPMTPLHPESAVQNRMIFDAERHNANRAPAYHRLDLRVDRRTSYGWGNIAFFLEMDNVYNRKNVRSIIWNPKTGAQDSVAQISFMVIGGVNVEF